MAEWGMGRSEGVLMDSFAVLAAVPHARQCRHQSSETVNGGTKDETALGKGGLGVVWLVNPADEHPGRAAGFPLLALTADLMRLSPHSP